QREIWCGGTSSSTVPEGSDFIAISAGERNLCGLHENGTVSCSDTNEPLLPPSTGVVGPPPPYDDFVQLSSGSFFSCGLRASGAIVCWGDNRVGQTNSPEGTDFTWLSAGRYHSCALRTNGKAVCWGFN